MDTKSLQRWAMKASDFRRGLSEVGQRALFYLSSMQVRSELPIDVVIVAAEKDLEVLPYTIDGVIRNVKHPLGAVCVVSPLSSALQRLCRRKGCRFVDERQLLDIGPSDIDLVVAGVNRSNWIYQQFLKWSADTIVDAAHYLVVDADTVLTRPQVFERNHRIVFNYSDEYHEPYFQMYQRLLREPVGFPGSFVSHHMLLERGILQELKETVQAIHGCDWKEAVLHNLDRSQVSGFSEYETYGHYVFLHHPRSMAIEYWSNLRVTRRVLRDVRLLGLQYGGKYKSMSFHSYASE